MNELVEFLTSKEIIVVYIVSGLACLLCFIVYLVEKNNEKLRRRHNTRELNKLVEQIKEETNIVEEPPMVIYEKPVLEVANVVSNEASSVIELLESTAEMKKIDEEKSTPILEKQKVVEPVIIATKAAEEKIEQLEIETLTDEKVTPVLEKTEEKVVSVDGIKEEIELEYTSIEPDQATARLELEKLTEELKKQEAEKEMENIALTNYEEEQEENAIISLEELVRKSKEMYAANELSQYADEGNEPISLQDLEKQMGDVKAPSYDEPFIIENVVPKDELITENVEVSQEVRPTVVLNDLNTVTTKVNVEEKVAATPNKKFKSSPIISPIYGIEKHESVSSNELELENTANYEKLDEEIKRTNEFLMTLKELQKKLD